MRLIHHLTAAGLNADGSPRVPDPYPDITDNPRAQLRAAKRDRIHRERLAREAVVQPVQPEPPGIDRACRVSALWAVE